MYRRDGVVRSQAPRGSGAAAVFALKNTAEVWRPLKVRDLCYRCQENRRGW